MYYMNSVQTPEQIILIKSSLKYVKLCRACLHVITGVYKINIQADFGHDMQTMTFSSGFIENPKAKTKLVKQKLKRKGKYHLMIRE